MKTFIVIPVYNEETVIQQVIYDLQKDYDNIIVVNDASTDNTNNVLDSIKNIHVLNHVINRGQGASLRTGTKYALQLGADIIVHFDADGQHESKYIKNALDAIKKDNVDVVLGSRFKNIQNKIPFIRKMFLNQATLFMKLYSGINLTDPQNGFRVMTKEATKKINITQDRRAHCSEILDEIQTHKIKYTEIPIEIHYTNYSKTKGDGSVSIMFNVLKDLFKAKIIKK